MSKKIGMNKKKTTKSFLVTPLPPLQFEIWQSPNQLNVPMGIITE